MALFVFLRLIKISSIYLACAREGSGLEDFRTWFILFLKAEECMYISKTTSKMWILEMVAKTARTASMARTSQGCICANRVHV